MIIFSFVVLIITSVNLAMGSPTDTSRNDYKEFIQSVLKNVDAHDAEDLEYCIPRTSDESVIYFSYDYSNESSPAFQALQQKIIDYSIKGNTNLLMRYCYLSQFVDGYLAEDYFINVDKVAKANSQFFCSILAKCNQENIKRLSEVRAKYCN
jgi:hypothetical protein